MTQETLDNQIRRLRFEHGEMTQQQLAEKVGVTRQTIFSIESGRYAPSLLLAFRIASAFDERIENVFQYKPAKKRAAAKNPSSLLPRKGYGFV